MIKLVLVEDDRQTRELTKKGLDGHSGIQVVGEFGTGNHYIENFIAIQPDVVLMDINMPGKSGVDTIAEAKPILPNVQYIVFSNLENYDNIYGALCAGATGYLVKTTNFEDMAKAIKDVKEGGSIMSPQIARLVVNSFQKNNAKSAAMEQLTKREQEAITFLSQGFNYKDISEKLFLSPETVRSHIRNIYTKLQVNSKTAAINKVFPRQ